MKGYEAFKTVIRNHSTGKFLAWSFKPGSGPAKWVSEYPDANEFKTLREARQVAKALLLRDAEIVERYGSDAENVVKVS